MLSLKTIENSTITISNSRNFDWRNIGRLARENDLNLAYGICMPASCSPRKVMEYSDEIWFEADLKVLSSTCRTNDPIPFEAIDIIAM